jgi:methylglyoxal synthase
MSNERNYFVNTSLYTLGVMEMDVQEDGPGIALVAHDACKRAMLEWARFNRETLSAYTLYTTGTTGALLVRELGLKVRRLLSGPYGGDAQIGALVAERRVRCVVFFWDPLTTQPHDVDVKALLRLTVLHNIPTACNRVTADFLISSPLFAESLSRPTDSRTSLFDFKDDDELVVV